jgi:branched-chain amino acid transport system substrate-binding protein
MPMVICKNPCVGRRRGVDMRREFVTLVGVCLVASAQVSAARADSGQCTITAGLFMPLSGAAATVGDDFRKAAILSHEKLPPEVRDRVKLVFEDTQMNATVAVGAYRALSTRQKLNAVVVAFAESSNALAPIVNKAGIPFIGCAPTHTFFKDRPFAFRHWTDAEHMSPPIVDELLRQERRVVGLVHSEHPAMSEFADYFKRYAESRGITFANVESILPSDTDFRGIAARTSSKKPDAVVYFLLPPQPSQFAKQYRVIDSQTPMFAFVNTESENEVEAAQGALEGVIYAAPRFIPSFVEDFSARYAGSYPEIYSGSFYDIIQMFGQAAQHGKCSPLELRDFLAGLKSFSGVAGEYGVTDGRDFQLQVELRTVKGGKFILKTAVEEANNGVDAQKSK